MAGVYQYPNILESSNSGGLTTTEQIAYSLSLSEQFGSIIYTMTKTLKLKLDEIDASIAALGGSDTDNSISSRLSKIEERLSTIETTIGVNEVSSITLSKDFLNVSNLAESLTIVVTAKYTKIADAVVTESVICDSSNPSIAVWDTTSHKVNIIDVGTCTLTFTYTYGGKSVIASLTVNVTNSSTSVVRQYVGYAADYTLIIGNDTFSTDTIAKTWTSSNTPSITSSVMGFWVITTLSIKTFSPEVGTYAIEDLYKGLATYGENTYNVYMAGPMTDTESTFTITIN